jgi:NADH dehydrogenase
MLRKANANVVLFDRHNYHLFQPLLYQVATAALSPADIASPVRRIFRKQQNVSVVLSEVDGADLSRNVIFVQGREVDYDYLVLACGATHAYFGNEHWRTIAPGLKTVDDALEIRKRILLAYEEAEGEQDEASRRAKLTFVVVGAGPTGVELAGALREIASRDIPRDFRSIDTSTARVILLDANDRVLKSFPEALSRRAAEDLQRMGVELRLHSRVTGVDAEGLTIGTERLEAQNVFWAAGVQASPLSRTLGVELDGAGRVKVAEDLSIPSYPNAFVIGDMASVIDSATGQPVPGLAPAAMQMGAYVGKLLCNRLSSPSASPPTAFTYRNRGIMATIGKAKAVADLHGWLFKGWFAWIIWCFVHLMFLITFRNRLFVMLNWIWNYIFSSKGARLITGDVQVRIHTMRDVTPGGAPVEA